MYSSEHRRPTDPVPCGERFIPYTGTTTHPPSPVGLLPKQRPPARPPPTLAGRKNRKREGTAATHPGTPHGGTCANNQRRISRTRGVGVLSYRSGAAPGGAVGDGPPTTNRRGERKRAPWRAVLPSLLPLGATPSADPDRVGYKGLLLRGVRALAYARRPAVGETPPSPPPACTPSSGL